MSPCHIGYHGNSTISVIVYIHCYITTMQSTAMFMPDLVSFMPDLIIVSFMCDQQAVAVVISWLSGVLSLATTNKMMIKDAEDHRVVISNLASFERLRSIKPSDPGAGRQ